jgi:hypothetical protein
VVHHTLLDVLREVVFFLKACFDPRYLFIALGFAFLDFLNKVVRLSDGSVRVHLDNVHVHVFFLRDGLSRDYVAHIYDALFTIICVVIKENVLSSIVRLINHQELGVRIKPTGLLPRWIVFLESHRTALFERLDDSLEDVKMISDHLVVTITIDIIQVHDFADSLVFARYHNSLIDSFT